MSDLAQLQIIRPGRHARETVPPAFHLDNTLQQLGAEAAAPTDFCTILDSRVIPFLKDGSGAPTYVWLGQKAPEGAIAELWERPEFQDDFQPALERCLDGTQQHYDTRLLLPRHGWRRFEVSLYPSINPDESRAILVIRDITERKRAESDLRLLLQIVHALSSSEDLAAATTSILERLCEASRWPLGEVWIPTPEGSLQLFGAARRPGCTACEQFLMASLGLTLRRDKGLPRRLWNDAVPVFLPNLEADPAFLRAEAAEAAGFKAAFAIPLKAGEQTLALMMFFLPESQAPDEHWMTLARAVAVELGAVFQREWTQEQLDSFFNRSLDMHCLAGFDGYLKRVNPAWSRTLGYSLHDLLSRPCVEFIHPDDRGLYLENLKKLGHGHDLTALELRCICQDGSAKWTLWTATSLPSQQLIVATARDISERKRTEAAVQQSEEHYRDLFHQAYQMQENLRRLSDRILEIQEQERSRISRDLHDEVGQSLTAINMNLAVLRNTLAAGPPETERRISDTQQLIEQTMIAVHNFSRELRPAMLDDLGLLPALRTYVKSVTERTGLEVRLQASNDELVERLDSDRKIVIYRVVQEGLNNVVKHAGAKRVEVEIAGAPQHVRLQLSDDGRGFAHDPAAAPKRLGLLGLAERVRLVGGEFAIASVPSRGTILQATVPYKTT
jgi:PAS domain S-box-containing protein